MVSQRMALEILRELGGTATITQIRQRAAEKDPLSCNDITRAVWGRRAWKEAEYHPKTKTWSLVPKPEDPLQILKLRLARGEITKEEYEELFRVLQP